jgi:hypothetical protein
VILPGAIRIKTLGAPPFAIRLPGPPRESDWEASAKWFGRGQRLAVLRATAHSDELDLVDVGRRKLQQMSLPKRGFDEIAVSNDARIALSITPESGTSRTLSDLQLFVLDVSRSRPVLKRLAIVPPSFKPMRNAYVRLKKLSWSSRGLLSYVVGQYRSTETFAAKNILFVTKARTGSYPRALGTFSAGVEDDYATAWAGSGRRIGYAFSGDKDVTVVRTVSATGTGQTGLKIGRGANVVDIGWLSSTPVLFKNDDADVRLYTIDLARRKSRLLLHPTGVPAGIAGFSRDGRYLALWPSSGNIRVFDINSHRRWLIWRPVKGGADLYLR